MSVKDMPETDTDTADGGKSRTKVIAAALVALVLAAGAYFVVFAGDADADAEPVAGEVLTLDSVQVNLAGGHYLRLGLALQLTKDAYHVDGSKALDAAIDQMSGLPMEELSQADARRKEKKKLIEHLDEVYHHEVMDVYFTEFVMQ